MVLIAAGQFCARSVMKKNLESVWHIIKNAADAGAKMVFLPETSDFITDEAHVMSLVVPLDQNEFVQGVRAMANRTGVWISVGVHEASPNPNKCYNSHLVIDSTGTIVLNYHKIHLFDVDIKGGPRLMESDTTIAGNTLFDPIKTPPGKLGVLTCYDIRFGEVAQMLRARGADLIAYASAFTVKTGAAHWEAMLRGRAIETQTYVVGAAAVGKHAEGRESWGHAMVVDPWGSVVAQCKDMTPEEPTYCCADIDLEAMYRLRMEIPVEKQRRPDVYQS